MTIVNQSATGERLIDLDARVDTQPVGLPAQPSGPRPVSATSRRRTPAEVQRWQRRFAARTALVDLLGSAAALAGAASVSAALHAVEWPPALLAASALLPLLWVAVLALGRCYEVRFLLSSSDALRRVVDTGLRLIAVSAVLVCLAPSDQARLLVVVVLPLSLLFAVAVRSVEHEILRRMRVRGDALQRVVVAGSASAVNDLVEACRRDSASGFDFVGVLSDEQSLHTVADLPVIGRFRDAKAALGASGADTLLVANAPSITTNDLTRVCWDLEGAGIDVYVTPNVRGIAGPRISIRPVGGLPLLHVDEPELEGPRRLLKSLFDRGMALAALVALSPLLLALALAVRLDSSGPALFRQTRVGRGGTTFTMFKFRSMVVDAEARLEELAALNQHGDDPLFKLRQDPRVTRTGGFLRKFSLDELPQLINIVRGDMSLVGPRPPLPKEVDQYADPSARRLLVRPGLTGLWQVSGRSDLSWEESLRLDLHYVENWSLFLDLQILWRTIGAVSKGRGAY